MLKKIASSFILASTLVGALVAPSYADDDSTFKSIVLFPAKVLGSSVGFVVGMPLGAVRDGNRGAIKATEFMSGKVSKQDGPYAWWPGVFAAPFGIVGGSVYGVFDGGVHGVKTGFEKPFSKDAFTFKEE